LTDSELVRKYISSQREDYFAALYLRYSDKVYSKCYSMLKNEEWAIDACQDIFLKIFLNLAKFEEKSQFSTWVYSITFNYCIDALRKAKKELSTATDSGSEIENLADDDNSSEFLEIEAKALEKILDLIPAEDRAFLIMKYEQGLSIREIADILGKTESAVKMKIKRARDKAHSISRTIINFLIIIILWRS